MLRREKVYERVCQEKTLLHLEEGLVFLAIQPPADEPVVWVEPPGRPHEDVAFKLQLPPDLHPPSGLGDNRHPDSCQGAVVRMPDARRREAVARLQVEIEHGGMGVLAAGMGEMDADMRLEGALVRRESGITVYPEERAPCRARVRDEMGAEPAQVRHERRDEHQRRILDRFQVPHLVPGEPVAAVVAL